MIQLTTPALDAIHEQALSGHFECSRESRPHEHQLVAEQKPGVPAAHHSFLNGVENILHATLHAFCNCTSLASAPARRHSLILMSRQQRDDLLAHALAATAGAASL